MFTNIVRFLVGKKTYVIGLSAIIWGFYSHNNDLIIIGLGLMGLRDGVTTEAKKVLDAVNTQ